MIEINCVEKGTGLKSNSDVQSRTACGRLLYSASQKNQNPEIKGCCDQVPGCMTVVILLS